MTLEEAFALTPEERARLDAAPFRGTDATGWRTWAGQFHDGLLASYADGEVDPVGALRLARSCSLGCVLKDRIVLMANFVEQLLRITPKKLGRRPPPHPTWVRHSAATLLETLLAVSSDKQLIAPNDGNGWTTPLLERAIAWLVTLGLTTPIKPRTLYEWYVEHTRAAVTPAAPSSNSQPL
jgi:hypothetical protein